MHQSDINWICVVFSTIGQTHEAMETTFKKKIVNISMNLEDICEINQR